jgi:hypothetical protein
VEVDLRDYNGRIVVTHDPLVDGENFSDWLNHFKHQTLILNIKCEGIEWQVLDELKAHGIEDYFFLDSSFPMVHALAEKGEHRIALRLSEWEGLDTIVKMKNRIQWVWVDCFSNLILNADVYEQICDLGLKICLVSPELQGRPKDIIVYRDFLKQEKICPEAICTKRAHFALWEPLLESDHDLCSLRDLARNTDTRRRT